MKMKNKKVSDTGILVRFVLTVLGAAFVGGCLGYFVGMSDRTLSEIGRIIEDFLIRYSIWFLIVSILLTFLGFGVFYCRGKKMCEMWSEEDGELGDEIENNMNIALAVTSVGTILFLVCFGLVVLGTGDGMKSAGRTLLGSVLLIVATLIVVFFQTRVVKVLKKIKPEKRGNALDRHFQRDWMESCDEAERLIIYKAAYRTYTILQKLFMIAIVVMVIISVITKISSLPFLLIGILACVHTIVYSVERLRFSKEKISE